MTDVKSSRHHEKSLLRDSVLIGDSVTTKTSREGLSSLILDTENYYPLQVDAEIIINFKSAKEVRKRKPRNKS